MLSTLDSSLSWKTRRKIVGKFSATSFPDHKQSMGVFRENCFIMRHRQRISPIFPVWHVVFHLRRWSCPSSGKFFDIFSATSERKLSQPLISNNKHTAKSLENNFDRISRRLKAIPFHCLAIIEKKSRHISLSRFTGPTFLSVADWVSVLFSS